MTSVSIPSSTGPLHGGFPSVREEITESDGCFEAPRTVKRCLSTPTSSESFKKRRKQSTPIRISTDLEQSTNETEGKQGEFSPDPDLRCPVCQLSFDNLEQVQSHVDCEHSAVQCKKEPVELGEVSHSTPYFEHSPETPMSLKVRPDLARMNDVQSKDWISQNMSGLGYGHPNPVFMAVGQFPQPDNMPLKPIRIFNPDAYCDLCNKEFCNKYFLKTHKANKHGIYTDIPTQDQLLNSVNMPINFAGNMKLTTTVPSVDLSIKNESKTSSSLLNPYSDVFVNPFSNKFSRHTMLPEIEPNENMSASIQTSDGPLSSSESEKLMLEEQTAEECSNTSITQTESTSIKNDSDSLYYDAAKLSPGQTSREIDVSQRYRRIGVMNPKAFCEICCKEYCNKYFLRTHKMKRHGIYIPDDKDPKMDEMGNFSWPSSVQTSPLNLIMTEQSNIHERKTTSPNDICCDLCGIKFQNASLAQLHNFTVHSKMYSKEHEPLLDNSTEEAKKTPESSKSSDKSGNPDAISEDLQKLQTMILQLNDLDSNKTTSCSSCNKEFENRLYLHAHMVTEHGMIPEDADPDVDKTADSENSNNNTLCDICGKDVLNAEEMKKHILEAHSGFGTTNGDPHKDDYNEFPTTPEKNGNRAHNPNSAERRFSVNITPTSSYCEICNKELCNKYFMKTHMQRMHGIEIENGSQIGGVVCDICNKELCSKYFLRVHKHNTHGIVEYGTSLLQPRKSESEITPSPLLPPETDSNLKSADLADLSQRYFTHFTEVCPICSRRFRSTKWLKAHLISDHGQPGLEKWNEIEQSLGQNSKINIPTTVKTERTSPSLKIPNGNQDCPAGKKVGIQNVLSSIFGVDEVNAKTYQCSYCPFTSPLLPLLFIHERSHSVTSNGDNFSIKCPVCPQSFLQKELFQRHLYSHHPFLPLPPLFNSNTSHSEMSRESQENIEETDAVETRGDNESNLSNDPFLNKSKLKKPPQIPKIKRIEFPSELSQSLKDVAKKVQMPATYAVPQNRNQEQNDECLGAGPPGYVMQAFLLEESASERKVVPSLVFLPMLQKQPAPLTVTFTLTPA